MSEEKQFAATTQEPTADSENTGPDATTGRGLVSEEFTTPLTDSEPVRDPKVEAEVIEEINTEEMQKENELSQPPYNLEREVRYRAGDEDDLQKILFQLFSGVAARDSNTDNPPTEFNQFMNDFKSGFNAGHSMSEEFMSQFQKAQKTKGEMSWIIRFLFSSDSLLPLTIACRISISIFP